jgi:hypothetical protein
VSRISVLEFFAPVAGRGSDFSLPASPPERYE